LNRLFGPHDWRAAITGQKTADDLFGRVSTPKKLLDVNGIARYMIQCMKTEFEGGVLDQWLPLGPDGAHWFSLLFAWANPEPRARLAAKFALDVLKRGK
jgi:hypothetical protein